MNRRVRIPLAFGPGLDRATGPMVVEPGAMEDVRNAYLLEEKLQIRKGFAVPGTIGDVGVPEITHILAGHPLRSEGIGIVVGWASAAAEVHVFRVSPDGTESAHLGLWFRWSLDDGDYAPVIHMAESFGRIFMAHDEPSPLDRAPTFVYDPITPQDGLLSPLRDTFSADIPGESGASAPAPGASGASGAAGTFIRFRGVVTHLDYLVGWGYGDAFLDRPEMVRISLPGDPRTFEAEHYWIVGDRRDPVLQCVPAARDLLAFKAGEWHALTGSSRYDFGQVRRDPLYGLLYPRLAVNVSGLVFFWAQDGPRFTDGSRPSERLEIPLDLKGYEAADLPEEGTPCEAFATYVWEDQVVLFVFAQRAYALTVRTSGDWKWSYWTFEWADRYPLCAFTLWEDTFNRRLAPIGYPEWVSEAPAGTFVDITVNNVNQSGDERLEVWMRLAGAPVPYFLRASTDVFLISPQVVRVGGLQAGQTYAGALRYRRGGQVNEAYAGDPSSWPDVSQGEFTTTFDPPDIGEVVGSLGQRFAGLPAEEWIWQRTSGTDQYLQMRIKPVTDHGPGHRIRVYRSPFTTPESWSQVAELVEGVDFDLEALGTDGGFTYQNLNPPQSGMLMYRVTSVIDAAESPPSANLTLWPGPIPEGHKGIVPATRSFWLASSRAQYEVTMTPHQLGALSFQTVRIFDNFSITLGSFTTVSQFDRGITDIYQGAADPIVQRPPSFGAQTPEIKKVVNLATAFPVGQGPLILGLQYEVTQFAVTDVSQRFQYVVPLQLTF